MDLKLSIRLIFGTCVMGACLLFSNIAVEAQPASSALHEMTIEVQPKIIALPGGEAGKNIAKVPMAAARVRSTELRDLNKLYNAVSIERIYEVSTPVVKKSVAQGTIKIKGKKKKSKLQGKRVLRKTDKGFHESLAEGGKISPDKLIHLKRSKKGKEKGLITEETGVSEDEIVVVNDVFIIQFQDYFDEQGALVSINMDEAVAAYKALPVVLSATKN